MVYSAQQSSKKYKLNIIAILKNFIIINIRKLIARLPESFQNSLYNSSLKKYDKRAGNYVDIYKESFKKSFIVDGIVDGKSEKISYREVCDKHLNWFSHILKEIGTLNSTILEVGAGELTTIVPLAKLINDPTLEVHASELSWSRCRVGKDFANSEGINVASITSASVTALPYADNSFDIVYTHYCLEELGGYEKDALRELIRITKRSLILIEASYELGSKPQRRKLLNRSWNIGLLTAAKSLGYPIIKHQLTPYCHDALHHGSIIQITKGNDSQQTINKHVCPSCKASLEKDNHIYFCKRCGIAYPILQGIPIFLESNGIIASRYMDFK